MPETLFGGAPRRPRHSWPGITHCGSWTPVQPSQEHGWRTRIVCTREPAHTRQHRSSDGLEWSRSQPTPRRPQPRGPRLAGGRKAASDA